MTVRRVVSHEPTRHADVVGDLVRLDVDTALIETRSGPVEVELASVVAAKPAPPSTADELALEAIAAAGWQPEESAQLGGWTLRATGGFTGRGNSVLPLRPPGRPLDEALEAARAWYAERRLPLRVLVPVESRRLLDAELGERGYHFEPDVHTMAVRLDQVPAEPDGRVHLSGTPDDGWFARYRDGAGAEPIARRLLTRHERACFAGVRAGRRTLAISRGTIDDGWLGITAVETDPDVRRTGLARAIITALVGWGRDRGATRGYVQVSSDNLPAVRLYEQLGFWVHHDYRYRSAP